MIDKNRVASIISDLNRYHTELEGYIIKTEKDLADSKTFFATSMIAFQILNSTLDLADEVVSGKNLGVPSTYKDIFWLLEKGKVIDTNSRKKLWDIIKYRNVLSHEYGEITSKDLVYIVQNLSEIKKFVKKAKELANKD